MLYALAELMVRTTLVAIKAGRMLVVAAARPVLGRTARSAVPARIAADDEAIGVLHAGIALIREGAAERVAALAITRSAIDTCVRRAGLVGIAHSRSAEDRPDSYPDPHHCSHDLRQEVAAAARPCHSNRHRPDEIIHDSTILPFHTCRTVAAGHLVFSSACDPADDYVSVTSHRSFTLLELLATPFRRCAARADGSRHPTAQHGL